jgi:hypothetical protein
MKRMYKKLLNKKDPIDRETKTSKREEIKGWSYRAREIYKEENITVFFFFTCDYIFP